MNQRIRQVVIVHFNTPELTEAAILSLRRHGGEKYEVTVFDNSDARPFTKQMEGVTVVDNTLGQEIDLDAELRKYPDRCREMGCSYNGDYNAVAGNFGSARHMMTVQYIIDNAENDFLLMDSDILIQQPVDFMFQPDTCVVGHVQTWEKAQNPMKIDRLVPMLLYVNAPMLRERGGRFFDPSRCYGLSKGGRKARANWYDTGAALLEDIRSHSNGLCGRRVDIRPLMVHFGAGSWFKTRRGAHLDWLNANRSLWATDKTTTIGDPDAKQPANKSTRIFIAAHGPHPERVSNKVYETIDMSEGGDEYMNVPGSFFSEWLAMHRVAKRRRLPQTIGFCQYRKYFQWMDDVPDLPRMVKRYGCLVSLALDLGMTVREQYDRIVGNVEDLDRATEIIEENYPDFAPAWRKSLDGRLLHPATMFVMPRGEFLRMTDDIGFILGKWLEAIGSDIDGRINASKRKYHIPGSSVAYQRRVGGQLCERIASAWIDWKFPEAREVPVIVTGQPITAN